MKNFSYREYDEYLSRFLGLARYLKVKNQIHAKIEVFKKDNGKTLYGFSIDREIDGSSFSQIVWAGMQSVGCAVPTDVAFYFGDGSKSFSAYSKQMSGGKMVHMNVNGFDEKVNGKESGKLGREEQSRFEELARIIADNERAGYRIMFGNVNEKIFEEFFKRDVVGMKQPSETIDEM